MEEQERIREFQSMRSGYMIVTQVMTHKKSNYTSMLVRFTKGMYCFELTFWLYGSSFMRFNFNEKKDHSPAIQWHSGTGQVLL